MQSFLILLKNYELSYDCEMSISRWKKVTERFTQLKLPKQNPTPGIEPEPPDLEPIVLTTRQHWVWIVYIFILF